MNRNESERLLPHEQCTVSDNRSVQSAFALTSPQNQNKKTAKQIVEAMVEKQEKEEQDKREKEIIKVKL